MEGSGRSALEKRGCSSDMVELVLEGSVEEVLELSIFERVGGVEGEE